MILRFYIAYLLLFCAVACAGGDFAEPREDERSPFSTFIKRCLPGSATKPNFYRNSTQGPVAFRTYSELHPKNGHSIFSCFPTGQGDYFKIEIFSHPTIAAEHYQDLGYYIYWKKRGPKNEIQHWVYDITRDANIRLDVPEALGQNCYHLFLAQNGCDYLVTGGITNDGNNHYSYRVLASQDEEGNFQYNPNASHEIHRQSIEDLRHGIGGDEDIPSVPGINGTALTMIATRREQVGLFQASVLPQYLGRSLFRPWGTTETLSAASRSPFDEELDVNTIFNGAVPDNT